MAASDLVGTVLDGRYRIDERLGSGGMASVYLAWQETLNRSVVVKVPHANLIEREEFVARFDREIQKLAELRHPRIVAVLEAGDLDGTPYLVMEHLSGGTLRNRFEAAGKESPEQVLEWLAPVAEALDFVHAKGVIHRDVKPGNILFDDHGNPFVADFGLAKVLGTADSALTRSGSTMGTVLYMSPEAGRSETLTGASDQYGLGVMIYEALGGRVPFRGDTPVSVMLKKLNEDPADLRELCPDLSRPVAATVMRAIARDPEQRFASCSKLAREFAGAVSAPSLKSAPLSRPEQPDRAPLSTAESAERAPRRKPGRRLVAMLLIPLLLVAGFFGVRGMLDAARRSREVRSFRAEYVMPAGAAFREIASEGPRLRIEGGKSSPDVWEYLQTYRHFTYFRQAVEGRLERETKTWETEHLNFLFDTLLARGVVKRGESAVADLRSSFYEFGGSELSKGALQELDQTAGEFDRHLLGWLGGIGEWVARVRREEQRAESALDRSFGLLKQACMRNKVIPHDRPEKVYEVARILIDAVYPKRREDAGTEGKSLTELIYGAVTISEVRGYLEAAKGLALPDGEVPTRVDALLRELSGLDPGNRIAIKRLAQQRSLGYLEGILGAKIPATAYDAVPTREGLRSNRDRISREIAVSGIRAWDQVRQDVVVIEGRADTVLDPATGQRKRGWWDTLIDLSRARTADALQDEYLKKGLIPFLSGPQWRSFDFGEEEREIYTKARLTELVQLELLNQQSFFQKPELATSIAGGADGQMKKAVVAFLRDMDTFWKARLKKAIPGPPETLTDLYRHVDMWSSTRKPFLITCAEIEGAIYDIRKLGQDESKIPFLRATQEERKRLFNTYVVCFRNATDPTVLRSLTVGTVEEEFRPLKKALEKVAGGGFADKSEARKVLTDIVQGAGGLANPFVKALDIMKEMKDRAGADSPREMLTRWMEPGIKRGLDQLVEFTAEDINAEWKRRSQVWISHLRSSRSEDVNRVFGEGGDFFAFRKEYLEPFFVTPGYTLRRRLPGANLAADIGLQRLGGIDLSTTGGSLRDPAGTWISEAMTIRLGLGGARPPEGLKLEYTDPAGLSRKSAEFRHDTVVEVKLTWSPRVNGHLRFIVNLGRDGLRDSVFSWSGPWAVAKAFADPRCQRRGDWYVWSHDEPNRGVWEVRLNVKGQQRLIDWYRTRGGDPGPTGPWRRGALAARAVRVVK